MLGDVFERFVEKSPISVMVRAMACRSPAEVMPKYSRTAALGLVTARSTMRPSSSSTKSSVTGWS